ncbi:MAG: cupin domain-containing protein [Candidatus Riflebacteria bacterium]|nr:cupin domain-containing protein [Candidatus Riflebacteria bacterium]
MSQLSLQAREWVTALNLRQHPEGGYFAEVYRADGCIPRNILPGHQGDRPFMTSIYFMLPSGTVSRFHRLKSDEVWYHHAGGSLTIHQLDVEGNYLTLRLGAALARGECLQAVVRAGTWFGATADTDEAALVGCAVAPGFDFADFELADRQNMLADFSQHHEIIRRLSA